jgi:hypothetical protein
MAKEGYKRRNMAAPIHVRHHIGCGHNHHCPADLFELIRNAS